MRRQRPQVGGVTGQARYSRGDVQAMLRRAGGGSQESGSTTQRRPPPTFDGNDPRLASFANSRKAMPPEPPSEDEAASSERESGGGSESDTFVRSRGKRPFSVPGVPQRLRRAELIESDEEDENSDADADSQDDDSQFEDEEDGPSEEEIREEKEELLFQLFRLEKQGYKLPRAVSMETPVEDLRFEYNRIRYDSDMKAGINFSRQLLMAGVSGAEYLSTRWNPLKLRLNGWSNTVMSSLDDYNPCLERLYSKWSRRYRSPPELELAMMLGAVPSCSISSRPWLSPRRRRRVDLPPSSHRPPHLPRPSRKRVRRRRRDYPCDHRKRHKRRKRRKRIHTLRPMQVQFQSQSPSPSRRRRRPSSGPRGRPCAGRPARASSIPLC